MESVEQKQYREELLEWCHNFYNYLESVKQTYANVFDVRSVDDWEETCRELIEKLQTDDEAGFDEYYIARKLYDQWQLLYSESMRKYEEMNSDVEKTEELSEEANRVIEWTTQEDIPVEDDLVQMNINVGIPLQEVRKILSDYHSEVSRLNRS